jgi:hypothetical protein
MCPGIRPATGWIGVLDRNALVLEQVGQVLDGVLGLGDGQTVAGHHDDLVGVGHLDRGVGRRGRLDHLVCRRRRHRPRPRRHRSRRPRWRGMERFIALAIRLVRIEPDAPTIMPATIIA